MDLKNSPIIIDGLYFALPFMVAAVFLSIMDLVWLSVVCCVVILFVLWFFRNPDRVDQGAENAVLSPADGTVIKIEEATITEPVGGTFTKISIFMSVLNVHVNRVPFTGTVEAIRYRKGKFFSADLDKASVDNEKNTIVVRTDDGRAIITIQIAGLIARRIVCWLEEGMRAQRGERFGLIRFGSRLEVFMPVGTRITVTVGDKVRAGETPIGYLS